MSIFYKSTMEVPPELLSEPLTLSGAQAAYELVEWFHALQASNRAAVRVPGTGSPAMPNVHWRVEHLATNSSDPQAVTLALVTQQPAISQYGGYALHQTRLHVSRSGNGYGVTRLLPKGQPVYFSTVEFSPSQWEGKQGRLNDLVRLQMLWRQVQGEQTVFRGDGIDMTGFEAAMAAVPDVAEPTQKLRGKRFTRFLGQIAAQLGEVPWWVWPI